MVTISIIVLYEFLVKPELVYSPSKTIKGQLLRHHLSLYLDLSYSCICYWPFYTNVWHVKFYLWYQSLPLIAYQRRSVILIQLLYKVGCHANGGADIKYWGSISFTSMHLLWIHLPVVKFNSAHIDYNTGLSFVFQNLPRFFYLRRPLAKSSAKN